jgi:HEPN domain-containing protein
MGNARLDLVELGPERLPVVPLGPPGKHHDGAARQVLLSGGEFAGAQEIERGDLARSRGRRCPAASRCRPGPPGLDTVHLGGVVPHSLQQVNDALAHGRFFFMDIAHDGIALFEADEKPLAQPKPKTPEANLELAREYFEEWFPAAMKRYEIAQFDQEKGYGKDAAFDLHQAAERLYHCLLLVCTFYTPHNHNLAFLRTQAERIDIRLVDAWPRTTRKERAMFEKLKEAYVKARYSKHYRISAEELSWLSKRVSELGSIVHAVCLGRIAELEATAKMP